MPRSLLKDNIDLLTILLNIRKSLAHNIGSVSTPRILTLIYVEAVPMDIDSNEDGSGNESGINKERQNSGEEANTSGNSALNRSNSVQGRQ